MTHVKSTTKKLEGLNNVYTYIQNQHDFVPVC